MIFYLTREKRLFQDLEGIEVTDNIQIVFDYFKNKREVGFDSETQGFDPYTDKILLYQLGDYENQFVIEQASFPVETVKPILEDESKTILMQNAKFDLRFLYKNKVIPVNIYDTFLAEAVLFTGIKSARKSLAHLAKKYCDVELDKSIRRVIHYEGASSRVIKYAADDTKYLIPIKRQQTTELLRWDLQRALDLDNMFVRVLAYIEFCGIYLNEKLWKAKMLKDKNTYEALKTSLDDWIVGNNLTDFINPQLDLFNPGRSCSINWASSKQVIPLMQSLGVDTKIPDEKTGKLKDSVDTKVLKKQQDSSELVGMYLSFKAAEKRVSTYGQNFLDVINPVTGRIHSSFTQILNTGRMSSGGKQGDTSTVNVQNIPSEKETRSCFTNQWDHTTLVNGDYSSMESVVFTNWSKEPGLIKFYQDDLGDMHAYIASKIFKDLKDLDLKKIKELHPDKRQIAKTAGFAIIFGGEGPTIAENVNIPIEEGDKIYNDYIKAFPKFKEYANKVLRDALDKGYILFNNISGRKAFIEYFKDFKSLEKDVQAKGFWDRYRWHKENKTAQFENEFYPKVRSYFKKKGRIGRMALNFPIQGSSAEITKLAGIYFFRYILENNLFNTVLISNVVHDEYLIECPIELAKEVSEKLQECMERAGEKFCKIIKLKAQPKITLEWDH
jgi:DNA polymerase-1